MPVNNISDILESGAFALQPSSAAGTALATGGTIVTHEVGIARVVPAAAVTGVIMAPGDYDGQFCTVQNKSTVFANSITFDVAATSNMAAGVNEILPGGSSKDYKWDANAGRWVALAGAQAVPFLAPNAGVLATGNTITPPSALYSKCYCAPAGAVTGIILAVGVIDGQEVTVVNNSAFTITPAVVATSHIADGAGAIAALTARTFIWDATAAVWFREA